MCDEHVRSDVALDCCVGEDHAISYLGVKVLKLLLLTASFGAANSNS